ncbi:cell envelope integrity protein TolA [Pseudomonas sp. BE134]|uniref:cell envelope integrity protein TolA n=1 Tax=Pseudomonas sp. BE134 TaxID=2817843 RepID=UPI00285D6789|nr:cell envelope integrity protein TolA [Pseudomonas sp. BE134]MDR6924804.1 TonB family protein [Pseudomonas sp. BE134]
MSTKRPQNKCEDCFYTWYPRGKQRSLKCPNCGERNISIVVFTPELIAGIVVVLIAVVFFVFGASRDQTTKVNPGSENVIENKRQLMKDVSVAGGCSSELSGKPRRDGHYISTDDADAAFIEKVSRLWVRPPSARNGMQAELLVKILPDGKILDVSVINSSGDTAFDLSTTNAVKEAVVICEVLQIDPKKYAQKYKERRVTFSPKDL